MAYDTNIYRTPDAKNVHLSMVVLIRLRETYLHPTVTTESKTDKNAVWSYILQYRTDIFWFIFLSFLLVSGFSADRQHQQRFPFSWQFRHLWLLSVGPHWFWAEITAKYKGKLPVLTQENAEFIPAVLNFN